VLALDFRRLHEIQVIFSHSHVPLALLCVAEGPIRFSALGAMMSERDGSRISDTQVTRVLKVLYDLGYSTTEPGADRGGPYRLTRRGRIAAQRLAASVESWQAFQPSGAHDLSDESS
jgi:hypothetical protein